MPDTGDVVDDVLDAAPVLDAGVDDATLVPDAGDGGDMLEAVEVVNNVLDADDDDAVNDVLGAAAMCLMLVMK